MSDPNLRLLNFSIDLNKANATVTSSTSYTVNYRTNFMGIFGVDAIPMTAKSSAQVSLANYLDIHLVIDASSSMGIGATLADQQVMFNATGCAIACHYKNPWSDGNYDQMRATGATFRIDYVREAVKQFVAKLITQYPMNGQIRLSVDLFQNELYPLVPPTTDLASVPALLGGIDISSYPKNNGTNIAYSLQQLNAQLPPGGTGDGPNSRSSFVILLTDGIEDSGYGNMDSTGRIVSYYRDPNMVWNAPEYNFNYFQTVQTIDPSACDALKAAGHKVLTASVEYLVPPMNLIDANSRAHFQYIGNTLNNLALASLQKCASSSAMAFHAGDSADIAPMFDNVLGTLRQKTLVRLTQ